jgi:hypothetical protein
MICGRKNGNGNEMMDNSVNLAGDDGRIPAGDKSSVKKIVTQEGEMNSTNRFDSQRQSHPDPNT